MGEEFGNELGLSRQGSEAARSSDLWQRSSMSAAQAPDPKRKGRFQIVEDDIVDNKPRPSRNASSASLSEKVQQVCHSALAGAVCRGFQIASIAAGLDLSHRSLEI